MSGPTVMTLMALGWLGFATVVGFTDRGRDQGPGPIYYTALVISQLWLVGAWLVKS